MSDAELLTAFRDASLAPARFGHAAHVRVAWLYLGEAPLAEATARFAADLRRYTAAHGVAGKYDEPLTRAWMRLVHARRAAGAAATWDAFAAANPDLLARPGATPRRRAPRSRPAAARAGGSRSRPRGRSR